MAVSNKSSGPKPKPLFWIVVFLVVIGLVWLSVSRAKKSSPTTEHDSSARSDSKSQPPTGQTLEISFYSSSAKKTWIDEMIKLFNASYQTVGDQTIKVKHFSVQSGESLDALKSDKIQPDMWSPADESWFELAASYWRNVKQKTLFDRTTPLVNIPLVIAVWEPMAKILGYPAPLGWHDIAKVTTNPKGWGAFGHPEWGKFRWGHPHPDSNSGFLAIISEVYAALGKTEGITPEDLKKSETVSFLKAFEGAVEHYGLSSTWIDDVMHAKGPAYLSATVQYENTIIETNEKNQNRPFKLVAVYPKEGCFWNQHPVAILKGDWMTPDKEAASQKFIDFLLGQEAQLRAMQLGLRPVSKEIEIAAPFDDAHGVNPKYAADRVFKVPEEGVLKRIRDLWEDVKTPASIVFVLDQSGSMQGDPIAKAKSGSIDFIKQMKPRDQLMIVVFNNTVTTLMDMCTIQQCGEDAISKLSGVFADGGTALYDAVADSYQKLQQVQKLAPNRRYALLLLSDGQDTSSNTKREDFVDSLPRGENFDAPKIYSIAYGNKADKDLLAEISNRTNARQFQSSPEEIEKTYKELSANF
jgi:Ca-activated chloride channel family protein